MIIKKKIIKAREIFQKEEKRRKKKRKKDPLNPVKLEKIRVKVIKINY